MISSRFAVGLVGCGRTGRAVAQSIIERADVTLEWIVRRSTGGADVDADIFSIDDISAAELLRRKPVDAVIDFSGELGIDYYGRAAADRGVSVVCAVSHFERDINPLLDDLSTSTRVLWSPNITLGINVVMLAASALKSLAPCAEIEIVEGHSREPAGAIVGTHEVVMGFPHQTIRLRHESLHRGAVGDGAIFAARELFCRAPGRYRMEDLLSPYFGSPLVQDVIPRPDPATLAGASPRSAGAPLQR